MTPARPAAWARRVVASTASALVLGAAMSGAIVAPTAAASPELLLSTDGVNYATSISGGLLDGLGLLVPGDSFTASLWIKNSSTTGVYTRVSVGSLVAPETFASALTLTTLDTGAGTTTTAIMSDLARCSIIVPSRFVSAGDAMRVDLTLTMLPSVTGVDAQLQRADLDLEIAMRDAVAGPLGSNACATDPPPTTRAAAGALSFTGSAPSILLVVVASLLVGFGMFFLPRRRREDPRNT